ncbi:class I SAM-dependent methyltransferase [Shimia abyssi]|uniref:Ubiquinone/menaquinone biosynthesis C-methylase UbiE n=1 Tax=Shimia abyssi TaxID=1662395 RepID=A0A2P8FEE3_9RHOB|nr:class I SAM-dependent methyltransferase [Shimia abyssi]PSL20087.1 ubiquinone/menaquinone biosynthesis C-methylase UbiE [Shimia abyssi]
MDKFRLTHAAAQKYDNHSVPAMFGPLARATLDRTSLPAGAHIIDIACGTGALTREVAARLQGSGRIVGADLNETMTELAAQRHPTDAHDATYVASDVCDLPFEAGAFDLAFCQQGLQFFPDKAAALTEIRRILKTEGELKLTCWSAISPFNGALSEALNDQVGEAASNKAKAPFSFRDEKVIRDLLEGAGFTIEARQNIVLERRFDNLFEQIMALPIEKDLREAGDDVANAVVKDVAAKLKKYAVNDTFVVPQEAYLFEARA